MINLPIKLSSKEIQELTVCINALFSLYNDEVDHVDYYNLRSLAKKLVDKQYKIRMPASRKPLIVQFNINEFDSLSRLRIYGKEFLSQESNIYYDVLLDTIYRDGHKLITDLSTHNFTLNGY